MAQLLRPDADVTDGAWVPSTGADLYATLDEASADDGDFILTASFSTCEVSLQSGSDPSSSANHIVRYRAKGNGVANLIVKLIQNTTVIATWTESAAAAAFTNYAHTLSAGEADAITDYTDLRLRFEVASGAGDGTVTFVQGAGTSTPNVATAPHTFVSNVTAGNKVVVLCFTFRGTDNNDPFIAGDCTRNAGASTATIAGGTFALLVETNIAYSGTSFISVGIWGADVTGTGSLRVDVAGIAGNYFGVAGAELSSNSGWDGTYLEDTIINSTATDNVTPATSGNATSAGKGVFLGVLAANKGSAFTTITPVGGEGSPFTTIFKELDDSSMQAGSAIYKLVAGGDTDSFDWTIDATNGGWACAGVVIKGVTP